MAGLDAEPAIAFYRPLIAKAEVRKGTYRRISEWSSRLAVSFGDGIAGCFRPATASRSPRRFAAEHGRRHRDNTRRRARAGTKDDRRDRMHPVAPITPTQICC
ncbi:TPA: hypothetical protein RJR39_000601 [Burkholderia cenocepacia]|uniref:hypothetical protein n=1 Tax=Burkholderia cenocepacia TaxID=95486 RepID=UPI001BA3E583|nr:hypothetical protein [Burkholderia cenocepacia]MBR8197717.1 hypothetical protein [Burkholderia cenocepacia]HDV6324566.1 hypothetical protein [Burkholderia cenocepacia]HDV6351021.1 hypothetical protein [Burkholderia cenocepacia]